MAETTGVDRMEQGERVNGNDRSQGEQASESEVAGLAWVGMQWRMEGYCGRAKMQPSMQSQCGDGNESAAAEAVNVPQAVEPTLAPAGTAGPVQPLSRRQKPIRRGPNQRVA